LPDTKRDHTQRCGNGHAYTHTDWGLCFTEHARAALAQRQLGAQRVPFFDNFRPCFVQPNRGKQHSSVALAAAQELEHKGLSARVVSMHTVKPLDESLLADAFGRFRAVAVVEEHSVIGGLGSAVAEWLARRDGLQPPLVACGTPDAFISEAGSQQWMREQCGLTGPAVAAKILDRLGKSP
jgi:hypothetical protein